MATRIGACLSLSGNYARFGAQAGQALRVWQDMTGDVDVTVEDDHSSARVLRETLPEVAARCDVLLGPYSTHLTRAAAEVAADHDLLLWNHGGAGDDVQAGYPGHVVSVPTPASRYAEPFLYRLSADQRGLPLAIAHGEGGFGRQAAAGAAGLARRLNIPTVHLETAEALPPDVGSGWDLFTAGSFDDDVRTISHVATLLQPPRAVCAVAAGVAEFRHVVTNPPGARGRPMDLGRHPAPEIGPDETAFVTRYTRLHGTAPAYPAVQAVAAAALATHCAHLAGSARRDDLWATATTLDTRTLFGPFRIDPDTGTQTGHTTVLTLWDGAGETHAA